jgi:chemotaxis protein CheX
MEIHMQERDLQVFIDGVIHYFKQISEESAVVGTPYLLDTKSKICYDYTGIIGISGRRKGCVYFTAPSIMLTHLLISIGEPDISAENYCDIVGEVANTISGNARQSFGREFMISVPIVIGGEPEQIKMPKDILSFVIPINWRQNDAALVISLE